MKIPYRTGVCILSLLIATCAEEQKLQPVDDAKQDAVISSTQPQPSIAKITLSDAHQAELDVYTETISSIDAFKDPQAYKDANLRTLDFARTLYPEPHPQLEDFKLEAAFGDFLLGNTDDALQALESSLPVYLAAGPDYRDRLIEINNNLGAAYNSLGKYDKSIPFLDAAIDAWKEKHQGAPHIDIAIGLGNLSMAQHAIGHSDEAIQTNLEALEIAEASPISDEASVKKRNDNLVIFLGNRSKFLGETQRLEESRANSLALVSRLDDLIGPDHPRSAYVISSLAATLIELRQYDSAEQNARRAVSLRETHFGRDEPETAVARNILVSALIAQSKYAQALPLAEYNYETLLKARGETAEETLHSMDLRAEALRGMGRMEEALVIQKAALDILANSRAETGNEWRDSSEKLAQMLLIDKQPDQARRIISDMMVEGGLDESQPRYHEVVMMGNLAAALMQPEEASAAVVTKSEAWLDAALTKEMINTGNAGDRLVRLRRAYAHALNAAVIRGDEQAAFRLMQKHNMGAIGRARAKNVMRDGLKRTADRKALVKLQDLQEVRTLALQTSYRAVAEGDVARVSELSKQLNAIDTESQTLKKIMSDKINPADMMDVKTLKAVQEKISPDTALLMTSETPYGLHILTLTSDDVKLETRSLSQIQMIARKVAEQLKSPEKTDFDMSSFVQLADLIIDKETRQFIGDRQEISVITNETLGQIPLSVGRYKLPEGKMRWAIEDYAFSYLTSVSDIGRESIRKVRKVKNFIGIGFSQAPSKWDTSDNIKMAALDLRYRGVNDIERLANLPPLPNAGAELESIRQSLSPDKSTILANREFTERDVRALDLSSADVLTFATHGLMAGELENYNEPALVLSKSSDFDDPLNDGLLSASEISDLKLSAQWVILSACNSGSGNQENGESLSGLATAFTYAGAQNLLVSHWPVRDDAAAFLTVNTLKNNQDGMIKAKALQKAMIDLKNNPNIPNASSPAIWAPFVLVGQ